MATGLGEGKPVKPAHFYQVGRVFTNGPGDLGSIPGRVIPKTLQWNLIPPCLTLSNIRYVSRVKWSNPVKGVAPSPTLWCSNYWKRSLLVPLDYGRQLNPAESLILCLTFRSEGSGKSISLSLTFSPFSVCLSVCLSLSLSLSLYIYIYI